MVCVLYFYCTIHTTAYDTYHTRLYDTALYCTVRYRTYTHPLSHAYTYPHPIPLPNFRAAAFFFSFSCTLSPLLYAGVKPNIERARTARGGFLKRGRGMSGLVCGDKTQENERG